MASKARTRATTRSKARAKAKQAANTSARKKVTAPRKAALRKKVAAPRRLPQEFVASHHREEDFRSDGLRTYAKYRDLGIAQATHGLVQAHVIRFVPPCRPEEVSKLHFHDVEFQMVYVLKGWIKTEFEGQGAVMMQTGSSWIQPPRIKHKVLDYSDDCEVLEIVLPADFKTVELT